MHAAQAGDEGALEALYVAHYDTIHRYCVHRIGDPAAVEDVVSQVFVAMIRGLPKYRRRGRPLLAWLYGIARRQVALYYRQTGIDEEVVDREVLEQQALDVLGPQSGAEERERTLALLRSLRMLPDSQREVVLLRSVLELSLAETAAAIDRSEGAVKQLHRRGLETLRRCLEPERDRDLL